MNPDPNDWLKANTYFTNESCSQTTSFKTNKKMNSELKHDSETSPVAKASSDSSQPANINSLETPSPTDDKYLEARSQATTTSKLLAILKRSPVRKLILRVVIGSVIAMLPGLIGLASNKQGLEWEVQLKISSKPNHVEAATKLQRVEKPAELAPAKKVDESK